MCAIGMDECLQITHSETFGFVLLKVVSIFAAVQLRSTVHLCEIRLPSQKAGYDSDMTAGVHLEVPCGGVPKQIGEPPQHDASSLQSVIVSQTASTRIRSASTRIRLALEEPIAD